MAMRPRRPPVRARSQTCRRALEDHVLHLKSLPVPVTASSRPTRPVTTTRCALFASLKLCTIGLLASVGSSSRGKRRRTRVQAWPAQVDFSRRATAICRRAVRRGDIATHPTIGLELPAPVRSPGASPPPKEAAEQLAALLEEDRALWATRCTPVCFAASCRGFDAPTSSSGAGSSGPTWLGSARRRERSERT